MLFSLSMNINYSKVKIESGISVPSLRRKAGRKFKINPDSLAGLLMRLEVGQSVVLPIKQNKIAALSHAVWDAKRRIGHGYRFTVRNYFTVREVYRGARVWRLA
jgi:hypothetical protein